MLLSTGMPPKGAKKQVRASLGAARLYVERQQRWKDIFSFAQNLAREKGLTEEDVTA